MNGIFVENFIHRNTGKDIFKQTKMRILVLFNNFFDMIKIIIVVPFIEEMSGSSYSSVINVNTHFISLYTSYLSESMLRCVNKMKRIAFCFVFSCR